MGDKTKAEAEMKAAVETAQEEGAAEIKSETDGLEQIKNNVKDAQANEAAEKAEIEAEVKAANEEAAKKDEEAKAAIAKTKKEAEAKRKEIEEAGKEAVQAREDEAEKIKQEVAAIDERKNTMLNEHDAKVAAADEELKGQIDQISADTNKQLDEMEAQTVA